MKKKIFESYKSAEKHLNLSNKYFSGHANRHKDKKFWRKGNFEIRVIE